MLLFMMMMHLFFVIPPQKIDQWNAYHYLRYISPQDIYSSRSIIETFPSATKEHIIPKKWLKKERNYRFFLHHPQNIFVCTALINSYRGSLPFRNISLIDDHKIKILDGRSGMLLQDRDPLNECMVLRNTAFLPPIHSRGAISRTCMHMLDLYPSLPIHEHVLDKTTMIEWNEEYPVTEWEIERQLKLKYFMHVSINTHVIQK